jgi:hypothetical protein
MFSAIYYPHTAVRDENFLKHALLYWDEVEYISPFHGYDVLARYPQTIIQELAKFTKPRIPTPDEKRRAHDQIMELLASEIPSWLQVDRPNDSEDRDLYTYVQQQIASRDMARAPAASTRQVREAWRF